MPQTPHLERHFRASDAVRDVVIGMSDGLTVPFALAAGLTGAVPASHVITTAGMAEIAAGAVAMGLGGYLAARSDADHYASELRREQREVRTVPEDEAAEIVEVFKKYGVTEEECAPVLAAFRRHHGAWVRFMMRFELGLERPRPGRDLQSALTIGGAYVAGGLIPIAPYFIVADAGVAVYWSVAVTLAALGIFGYAKGGFTDTPRLRSALQTMLIGGCAAGAAFLLARLIA